MYNEEAIKAYHLAQEAVKDQIAQLQVYLVEYDQKVKTIHWGHVGDMNHIAQHLAQLTEGEDDAE